MFSIFGGLSLAVQIVNDSLFYLGKLYVMILQNALLWNLILAKVARVYDASKQIEAPSKS